MSQNAWVFICARETYALSVPQYAATEADYRRNVSNAFRAIGTGFRRVGDLVLRPSPSPFDDHLLCDGSTIQRTDFPQLVDFLGGTDSAALPNYLAGLSFATTAPAQTVQPGGTISTGGSPTTPTAPGQTGGTTGGNVSSGGRPREPGFDVQLQ